MTIAYNSAYVQTETLNFTFAHAERCHVGHDNVVISGTHFANVRQSRLE